MAESSPTDWHRLFGLMLTDFFDGSPFRVETELDVSKVGQFIDVLIIRKEPGEMTRRLPDGMEDLADYNVISFKSYQEGFTAWSAKELIAYYVNYRKQLSDPMIPEDRFRLFAVCVRFPRDLARVANLEEIHPGVSECDLSIERIRIIVISRLSQEVQNALLQLFSAQAEQVQFAQQYFRHQATRTSSLLQQLLTRYQEEGLDMPVDLDKWVAEFQKEQFLKLDPKDRLEFFRGMPVEQRRELHREALKDLSLEERLELLQSLPQEEHQNFLQSLPPEERLELFQSLPPEERLELFQSLPLEERLEGLEPEELLKRLSPNEIQAYLDRLKGNSGDQPEEPPGENLEGNGSTQSPQE